MNVDETDQLARRVAVYAALADPARLRITDTLADGDASPSELAALLAMPSNLLAHHLHVLEAAGVVSRHRSEGDKRRTYLRLSPDGLNLLAGPSARPARRVLFVCTANSARSHLAAALWRQASEVPATSAGTHPAPAIDPGAVAAARRHGLPLPEARPQRIGDIWEDGDLVVTVCDRAHEELGEPAALHWSVPDPVPSGDPASFDAALDELNHRVWLLAPRVGLPANEIADGHGAALGLKAARFARVAFVSGSSAPRTHSNSGANRKVTNGTPALHPAKRSLQGNRGPKRMRSTKKLLYPSCGRGKP